MTADGPAVRPYGAWPSPLRAVDVAGSAVRLQYVSASDGRLYWVEARPSESGRCVLVSWTPGAGAPVEIGPASSNIRTRVHEYGGRPYVACDGTVVYAEFGDQRLRVWRDGRGGEPLTPAGYRYADGSASTDGRRFCFVREDHTRAGEPANTIVAFDPAVPSAGTVLFDGSDFVAYPRVSRDGRIAFVAWNHPHMPWDATTLIVARLTESGLADLQRIAGAPGAPEESVIEPLWDVDGTLYFLSDRSGYWNLYRWRGDGVEPVAPIDADLGEPPWVLGLSTYALTGDGRAVVRACRNAVDGIVVVDLASGAMNTLPLPFSAFDEVGVLGGRDGFAIAAPDDALPVLLTFDLHSGECRVVRDVGPAPLPQAFVSYPEAIEFATAPGPHGEARTAHAFFFAPRNPACTGPAGTKPPLIVLLHGGPTAHASPGFPVSIHFWTTRGFAVVNVNYGGSSGFGRAYRERLRGQWGVVDLQDAVAAVDHLAETGRVDGTRVAIRGASAGGYTVLAGLAFTRRFAAGINYFGIADLESIAAHTHKLESRYLDSLIAPLPEGRAIYRARSPIHHLDALEGALITFQGEEDRAVPPDQSRRIVEAVRARGRPVAYIEFKGEQHGFRQAANIARALEAELYFLGRIFGFEPADRIEPVAIDNFPG